VFIRPFLTIIGDSVAQDDDDYNVVHYSLKGGENNIILHGESTGEGNKEYRCSNLIYGKRFNVIGEYVCVCYNDHTDLVGEIKRKAIDYDAPDFFEIDGLKIYKRNYWQLHQCFI